MMKSPSTSVWHHRIGGDAEGLEHEGTQHQHRQRHRKEAARVIHRARLRNVGQALARSPRGIGAEPPEQRYVRQPDDAVTTEISSSTALKSSSSADSSRTTPAMMSTGSA